MKIIGIGVDLVSTDRLRDAIELRPGFLKRVYTDGELQAADVKSRQAREYRLAARFAAKEAFYKALGKYQRGLSWKDVEVTGGGRKRPELVPSPKAQEALERAGVRRLHLSLSHDGGFAIAYVILEA